MIRAALLDIDGTLVDSNDAHARAWVQALLHHGHVIGFERVRELIGKGGDKLLAEAAGMDLWTPQGQAIDALRARLFMQQQLPAVRALPAARALLLEMRRHGLRLVVATSAKSAEMTALLDVCGARALVHAHTSSDDAERSKPDPDILQVAIGRAQHEPSEILMLGDTPYDVESAQRAGVGSVALRSGGWGDADLAGALAIYDDAADLLRGYDASPFASVTA